MSVKNRVVKTPGFTQIPQGFYPRVKRQYVKRIKRMKELMIKNGNLNLSPTRFLKVEHRTRTILL